MPDNVIQVVNDMGIQDGMPNGIEFRNIHHESSLADLFAEDNLNNDNSIASDNNWGLNKNHEEDLKKKTFDKHVNGNEVQDLNIDNKDIIHLYNVGDLSRNIGIQHKQEDQDNHFGGPVVDKHQPDQHLEGHDKGNNIGEEVDEVAQVVEEVRVVGDDESSTDENFDLGEHDNQHVESKEGSESDSAQEDNVSMDAPAKDPVEYRQRPLM